MSGEEVSTIEIATSVITLLTAIANAAAAYLAWRRTRDPPE
jgi:hypothetical protein